MKASYIHEGKKRRKQLGATLIEYALLVALIAVLALPPLISTGQKTADTNCRVDYAFSTAGTGMPLTQSGLQSMKYDRQLGIFVQD